GAGRRAPRSARATARRGRRAAPSRDRRPCGRRPAPRWPRRGLRSWGGPRRGWQRGFLAGGRALPLFSHPGELPYSWIFVPWWNAIRQRPSIRFQMEQRSVDPPVPRVAIYVASATSSDRLVTLKSAIDQALGFSVAAAATTLARSSTLPELPNSTNSSASSSSAS